MFPVHLDQNKLELTVSFAYLHCVRQAPLYSNRIKKTANAALSDDVILKWVMILLDDWLWVPALKRVLLRSTSSSCRSSWVSRCSGVFRASWIQWESFPRPAPNSTKHRPRPSSPSASRWPKIDDWTNLTGERRRPPSQGVQPVFVLCLCKLSDLTLSWSSFALPAASGVCGQSPHFLGCWAHPGGQSEREYIPPRHTAALRQQTKKSAPDASGVPSRWIRRTGFTCGCSIQVVQQSLQLRAAQFTHTHLMHKQLLKHTQTPTITNSGWGTWSCVSSLSAGPELMFST